MWFLSSVSSVLSVAKLFREAASIFGMIVLFTDFGFADPYVGQMHGVLAREALGVPVIDLFHSVPNYDIRAAAYLLPVFVPEFPSESVFVCVVDPGVGSARRPVMLRVDGRWFVGPDNGLFRVLAHRASVHECRHILWRPQRLSASFHGRDLFAPVAARLALGEVPESEPTKLAVLDSEWPDDLSEVIYIDHFGNAITGLRAKHLKPEQALKVHHHVFKHARIFGEVGVGEPFWYENSNGLVEIAVNQGHAAQQLGIKPGDRLTLM